MRFLRAGLVAVAAFAVGYLLPGPLRLPVLFYDPASGVFQLAEARPSPWIRYYGDLSYAFAAALLGFAAGLRWSRGNLAVLTSAALSLVALDVLFYLSRLLAAV